MKGTAPMTRHEQDIDMMARLYDYRKAARFMLRETYDVAVTPWRDLIGQVMARDHVPALRAVLRLAESIHVDDGVPLMLLFAAGVDVCESGGLVNAGATASSTGAPASAQDPSSSGVVTDGP